MIYVCPIVNDMPTFVIEDHMIDWHICQICCRLEIKLLLLLHEFRIRIHRLYSCIDVNPCQPAATTRLIDMLVD